MPVDCKCGGDNPTCYLCDGRGYYHKRNEKKLRKSVIEQGKNHKNSLQDRINNKIKEEVKDIKTAEVRISKREKEWERLEAIKKRRKEASESKKPFTKLHHVKKILTELNDPKNYRKKEKGQKDTKSRPGKSIGENAKVTSNVLKKPSKNTQSISKREQDYLDKIKKRLGH